MREAVYHKMAAVEADHWWFRARRRIVREVLTQLDLPPRAEILEIGCGTGGNLGLLGEFGTVAAVDSDEVALSYARQTGQAEVLAGALPDELPFADRRFDLVVMLDVLEHIAADEESLRAVHERIADGGRLLMTVPAYQFLWSSHDEVRQHQRRYDRRELGLKCVAAGFRIRKLSYFNTILFPPIAVVRMLERRTTPGEEAALDHLPPRPVNALLLALFACERFWLRSFAFPYGVSLMMVGSKNV